MTADAKVLDRIDPEFLGDYNRAWKAYEEARNRYAPDDVCDAAYKEASRLQHELHERVRREANKGKAQAQSGR